MERGHIRKNGKEDEECEKEREWERSRKFV